MYAIETRGLSKAYRGRNVVDGLDMHVARGDIYGFVGRNGAGKSTTMKMICGMIRPTGGEVRLFDRLAVNPSGGVEHGEAVRIGALVENPGLYSNMTAFENMRCKAMALGLVDSVAEIERLLRIVGLADAGKKPAKSYSLGMKQRLGLALALLGSPDVLLLDEPMNGLDPEGVREMTAEEVAKACDDYLVVRTAEPERTLALLAELRPSIVCTALPDGSLRLQDASGDQGALDAADVGALLAGQGIAVSELGSHARDLEDFFLKLMGGGSHA
ncbi:MAG: ATP-binding cassette domain-containing protein [Eggerthella sp.]|nr:ATP-binding cassette domain-containing protein [Eggerthella sp.]